MKFRLISLVVISFLLISCRTKREIKIINLSESIISKAKISFQGDSWNFNLRSLTPNSSEKVDYLTSIADDILTKLIVFYESENQSRTKEFEVNSKHFTVKFYQETSSGKVNVKITEN